MHLRLVHASAANRFMRDILEAIAFEARALGAHAEVVDDEFDPDPSAVHVIVPHEFFAVTEPADWPSRATLARTIALTVEHPGTPWFETSTIQSRRCGAVMEINADALTELARRNIDALPFQIGYTAHWDHWHARQVERDVDILYMGSTDDRRDAMLAEAGRWWSDIRARLLIPTVAPKPGEAPDSITGVGKYELLARSRLLVNAHRLDSRCLEWVRVIEAMSNGCVVLSEHSSDAAPLVPGEHFVSARLETLGLIARGMVADDAELNRLRRNAYQFVRSELPMRPSVEAMLTLAADLVRTRRTVPPVHHVPEPPRPGLRTASWPTTITQIDIIGGAVRRIEQRLRRLDATVHAMSRGEAIDGAVEEVLRTPATQVSTPRVSVITANHQHRREVTEALASIAACAGPAIELLVQDDASTDGSVDAISEFLQQRPWLPARLFAASANRGASATRNHLLQHARGEFVFVLDADNGVYPDILRQLVDALDADPDAAFAYAPIAVRRGNEFIRLVSARPWLPDQLRHGNYIDAMALVRTSVLREFGGWDPEMDGWEDFHLWARMAEAGLHAAFVPQVLSWYRTSSHSLSVQVSVDAVGMWSRIRAAAPTVMHE